MRRRAISAGAVAVAALAASALAVPRDEADRSGSRADAAVRSPSGAVHMTPAIRRRGRCSGSAVRAPARRPTARRRGPARRRPGRMRRCPRPLGWPVPAGTSGSAAAAGAGCCAAAPQLAIGLNAQTAGWGSDAGLEQARAAKTGIGWLREELTWNVVEPADDAWNWELADRVIGEASRRGLRILPLLLGTPSWAGPSWNTMPADPAEFAEYAARVAGRYGPQGTFWRAHPELPRRSVTALEVWNEPYLRGFSASGIDPGRYARLVRATAIAVRDADPGVAILAAADTRDDSGGDWITGMFAAVPDLARYFDAVAVHPYSRGLSPDVYTPPDTRYQWRRIDEIRAELVRRGADDPLWITELGWSTCPAGAADDCIDEQQQAQYLGRAIELSRARSWVAALFVYAYRAWEEDADDREDWFGIVHSDGTPKPAWEVVRRATGERARSARVRSVRARGR